MLESLNMWASLSTLSYRPNEQISKMIKNEKYVHGYWFSEMNIYDEKTKKNWQND